MNPADAVAVSPGACDVAAIKARDDDGSVSAGLSGIVCGGSNVPEDYDRIELRIPKGTVHRFRMNTTVTLLTDVPVLVAEVERLRAALNAADKVIGHAVTIMEGIEMDTDADRDLHGRAIEAIQRGRAAALSLGVQS